MSRLDKRIAELEKRAAEVVSGNGSADRLWKEIEVVASRLEWENVTPEWVGRQSVITALAVILHGPVAAVEAAFPRFLEISKEDDTAGKLARNILEKVE